MATIDIKLKSYDELTFEITKLNTDLYLKNKEIERLNNIINEAIKYNKELCKLYDIGSTLRSNADTNLIILEDEEHLKMLKDFKELKEGK